MYYKGAIYEYDIEAAAFNIFINEIAPTKIVTRSEIDKVKRLKDDKIERNMYLGKLQRKHPEIKEMFTSNYKRILELFINNNNIKEEDILFRTKDSLVVTVKCKHLTIDNYHFISKSTYNQYLSFKDNFGKTQHIYYNDVSEAFEVKGSKSFVDDNKKLFTSFKKALRLFFVVDTKLKLFVRLKYMESELIEKPLEWLDQDDIATVSLPNMTVKLKYKNVPEDLKEFIEINHFVDNLFKPLCRTLLHLK